MAYWLTHLLQDALIQLGQLNVSTVTTGSTVALADTKQTGQHSDDDWKNGSVFMVRTTDNEAPADQYSLCTGYTDSTGSFTTTWTAAPGVGDTFGFASDYYPLYQMIQLANQGIAALGMISLVNDGIDTEANRTEYEVNVQCKPSGPMAVYIQGYTGDSNDNRYVPVYGWEYLPAIPGAAGTLVFSDQPIVDRKVKIVYEGYHDSLTAYSSIISETIAPELAMWSLVVHALRWQLARSGGEEGGLIQQLNDANAQLELAKVRWPIWQARRKSKLLTLYGFDYDKNSIDAPDAGVRT